jgi:hypothetical protein
VTSTERWLRGPVPDGQRPGGVASLAFHVFHLAGSTQRLLLAALGEDIGAPEREARERETAGAFTHDPDELLDGLQRSFDVGVLFHIAEHAARHAGQVVTTAKLIRAEAPS